MNAPALRILLSGLWTLSFALAPAACAAAEGQKDASAQVRITQVDVALSEAGPVVLLTAENRAIPIFIDPTVAEGIHAALTGGKLRRPLTHQLMHTVLAGFDGRVTGVVITLKETTYYAALTVDLRGTSKVFDSRASDAIALAVHFKAPILVGRDLLESSGRELPQAPPGGTPL